MGKIIQFRLERYDEAKLKAGFYDCPGFHESPASDPQIIPFPRERQGAERPPTLKGQTQSEINAIRERLERPGFILVGFKSCSCLSDGIEVYWLPETGPYVFHWEFGPLDRIRHLKPMPRRMSGLKVALRLLEDGEPVLLTPELLKPGRDHRPEYLEKHKSQIKENVQ